MGEKEGDEEEEEEVRMIHVMNGTSEIVIILSLQISAEITLALALIGADDPAVAAEVS